jgi:hypothetical protein
MKQKGWDYSSVLDPFGYWAEVPRRGTDKYLTAASISPSEKSSARDDVSCKHSTGLLGTWLAADVAYQAAIVEQDAQRLRDWSHTMNMVLTNANEIAAGGRLRT